MVLEKSLVDKKLDSMSELLLLIKSLHEMFPELYPESIPGWLCIDEPQVKTREYKGEPRKLGTKLYKDLSSLSSELFDHKKASSRETKNFTYCPSESRDSDLQAMAKVIVTSFKQSLQNQNLPQLWVQASQSYTSGRYLVDLHKTSMGSWPVSPLPDDGEVFVDFLSQGRFEILCNPSGGIHLKVYGSSLIKAFETNQPSFLEGR
jgi:hypothetical protein